MEFIRHHATHIGHHLSVVSQERVQLFRGADEDVAFLDVLRFRGRITNAEANGVTHGFPKFLEILVLLHSQRFERDDVDGFGTFMSFGKPHDHSYVSEK